MNFVFQKSQGYESIQRVKVLKIWNQGKWDLQSSLYSFGSEFFYLDIEQYLNLFLTLEGVNILI